MSELRDWWVNMYAPEPGCDYLGALHLSPLEAEENACRNRVARLHICLKPEGAPRRYASEANRRAWETQPEKCRVLAQTWLDPENIIAVRQPDLNAPKGERSAA